MFLCSNYAASWTFSRGIGKYKKRSVGIPACAPHRQDAAAIADVTFCGVATFLFWLKTKSFSSVVASLSMQCWRQLDHSQSIGAYANVLPLQRPYSTGGCWWSGPISYVGHPCRKGCHNLRSIGSILSKHQKIESQKLLRFYAEAQNRCLLSGRQVWKVLWNNS